MRERKIFEDQGVIPTVTFLTASTSLTVTQQVVRATANSANGSITITLPAVAHAAGKIFSVQALNADTTNVVSVQDQDDSEDWTDITLNGAGEGCLLYSDGRRWWPMVSDTA